MNSYFYNDIIDGFITGSHNSLVLPSSMSKTDIELLVEHVSKLQDKSQDKPIIDKCKSLTTILKDSITEM